MQILLKYVKMKSTSAKKVFMVAGFQTIHFQYHQCWDSLTEKFET